MRKLLNYLLGEDTVNEQSDKELKEALIGLACCWVMAMLCWTAIYIFG